MIATVYRHAIESYPKQLLLFFFAAVVVAAAQLGSIRLDASSDSLLLQGDPDLERWREVSAAYASNEFLLLTWEPPDDLLGPSSLVPLAAMVAELEALSGVLSVTSVLDVPLLESPPLGLSDLTDVDAVPTLRQPSTRRDLALLEFTTSPLYQDLLVSEAGDLTAVQVVLAADTEAEALLAERERLRSVARQSALSARDRVRLQAVEEAYDAISARVSLQRDRLVAEVRAIADEYRDSADIFVGGVPMIAADMVAFVRADLVTFGMAIIFVMGLVLWLIFRDWRWVVTPIACCGSTALLMLALLALLDWRMTVISSNFVAVLLIITLSLSIHLVVRYRELEQVRRDLTPPERAVEAARLMLVPCLYTALTTMVAFASLVVAGLKPVIDFGWMMTIGIIVGFIVSFTLVPALMATLPTGRFIDTGPGGASFTRHFSALVEARGGSILLATAVLTALTILGVSRLQVENRFIDYFKESTEIYQGMELLDARLGGTIPLDIVLSPPDEVAASEAETVNMPVIDDAVFGDDEFFDDDPFASQQAFDLTDDSSPSYWFSLSGRRLIDRIHQLADSRNETGKVLSLSTSFEVIEGLYGSPLGSVELALLQNNLPSDVESALLSPYYDKNTDQARITVRVMETSEALRRDAFLRDLRELLLAETKLAPERLEFTGLLVLYNNVLQSLFSSQILTLGVVFTAIGLMFWALFRSLLLALLALAPNLLAAGMVLGIMGLGGIPLDIMTMTIAAIVVGIGVDDCIHYMHRFRSEFSIDGSYHGAMHRSHGSIGRAMYYTTLTIVVGFSMLTLSNFTPSLYFGLLTVTAMIAAVAGALLLLPKLLLMTKPLGPGVSDD